MRESAGAGSAPGGEPERRNCRIDEKGDDVGLRLSGRFFQPGSGHLFPGLLRSASSRPTPLPPSRLQPLGRRGGALSLSQGRKRGELLRTKLRRAAPDEITPPEPPGSSGAPAGGDAAPSLGLAAGGLRSAVLALLARLGRWAATSPPRPPLSASPTGATHTTPKVQ